jgi:hypothetical protein
MIEYLHDAIRATAGTELNIITRITEDNKAVDGVELVLHLGTIEVIAEGFQDGDAYIFTVPAEITKGYTGRFWYCFRREGEMLCFKQPIYLV